MFYSQFILAKKGPLGTIWIAAHLERKLRKNQVADTDIGVSVDSILFPEVPIALRLSSHLLLGVVRIYSRKVNYLFDDCSDTLLKVRQAFRSAAVDLPPEESKAPYHSITLPETFDLDDFELPDAEVFQGDFVDHHVSSKEQITLQDTLEGVIYPTSQFGPDERFGDGDTSEIGLDLDEELLLNRGESSGHGVLLTPRVDPQPSVDPSSIMNGEETREKIDDASDVMANYTIQHYGCNEFQGPATPGLLEEPYLPSPQEAQVSEDHMEEDHNLVDPVAKGSSDVAPTATAANMFPVLPNGCTVVAPKDLEVECIQVGRVSDSNIHDAFAVQSVGERGEAQTIDLNGSLEPSDQPHKAAHELHENNDANDVFPSTLLENRSEMDKVLCATGISTSIDLNGSLEPSDYSHKTVLELPEEADANDRFLTMLPRSRSELDKSSNPTGISTTIRNEGQLEQINLEKGDIVQNARALMPEDTGNMYFDNPSDYSHKTALELPEEADANDRFLTMLSRSQSELDKSSNPTGISTTTIRNEGQLEQSNLEQGEIVQNTRALMPEDIGNIYYDNPSDYSHKAALDLSEKADANDRFPATLLESRSELDKSLDPTEISTTIRDNGELGQSNSEQRKTVQNTMALMPEDFGIMYHDFPKDRESAVESLLRACNRGSDLLHAKEVHEVSVSDNQVVIQSTMDAVQDPTVALCKVADGNPNTLYTEASRVAEEAQNKKEHGVAVSDLPSPEKMLSLPAFPVGQDFTPVKEFFAQGDQHTILMNQLSGNKRSFTESTVTPQSLNSAVTFEAFQSKSSAGIVPRDNDLLSSILVGRRSSALVLKPTPPSSELVSLKRRRVGSRSGARKRKALVDDSMVLHGDIIREQLVSTVDIRRVRKKAPSTHPEIWMLQKQALEDGLFTESLFTGVSTELVWSHCQEFDLSRMKIVEDDGSKSDLTASVRAESRSGTTVCEDLEHGKAHMPSLTRDDDHEKSLELITEFPIQSTSMVLEELNGNNTEKETLASISCNENSQAGWQENKTELERDRMALDDAEANQSLTTEVQFQSSLHYGPEHNANSFNDDIAQSSKEIGGADDSFVGTCVMSEEQCVRKDPCEDSSASVKSSEQKDDSNIGDRNLVEHRSEDGNITVRADFDSVVATTSSLADSALPVYDEYIGGALSPGFGGLEVSFQQDPTNMRSDPGMVNNDEVNGSGARYDNNGPALDYQLEGSKLDSTTLEGNLDSTPLEGNLSEGNATSVEAEHLGADQQIPLDAAITTDCESGPLELPHVSSMLDSTPLEGNLSKGNVVSVEAEHLGSDQQIPLDAAITTDCESGPLELPHVSSMLDSTPLEGNFSGGNAVLVEGEHLGSDQQIPLDADITAGCEPDPLELPHDFEDDYDAEHDTGFLNFDDDDDDEIAEDDKSMADDAKETDDLDNSGWSTRTRAVANYLQNLFNKEALRGRRAVCLDNLLTGKTRKEASRMFFETLVLSTRDYVEAEQQDAFGNINVKPRLKLMKSTF